MILFLSAEERRYCNRIDEANKQFGNSYDLFCSNLVYRNAVAMCVLQIICGFKESQTFLSPKFRKFAADPP